MGFDRMDRTIMLTIIDKFSGGPVGLDTLAAAVCEESDTIEEVYEPYLIQHGFLNRTPRGRTATVTAYHYFRRTPAGAPTPQASLFYSADYADGRRKDHDEPDNA
jgi:holliday junction DNA helicase RuvB